MKGFIVLGILVAGIVVMVMVLGTATEAGDYDDFDAGVRGPVERGATSEIARSVTVWALPKDTISAKERTERRVGTLEVGEKFQVLNHFRPRQLLWVQVQSLDNPLKKGWIRSPSADPVHAKKLN